VTKTREELVARALKKLKVVGAGQTASSAVTQSVDQMVGPIMSDLSVRGVFSWGDEDELPDEAFEHLAGILANAAAPDFGKQADEQLRILLESRLRLLNGAVYSGQTLKTTYY